MVVSEWSVDGGSPFHTIRQLIRMIQNQPKKKNSSVAVEEISSLKKQIHFSFILVYPLRTRVQRIAMEGEWECSMELTRHSRF